MSALKRYRDRLRLSQEELAARIGTTKATVSRLEAGLREPSLELMRKISAATEGEVSPNDFLGEPAPEAADATEDRPAA